ncbi:MAG: ADP-ribosylglycohydrolase family protein [Thermodesulfobacteriota bacterium]
MIIPEEILRDKFCGAILGCFLGDAFGAGFEGMNPHQAIAHLSRLSEKFTRTYTDDMDMTLALAESIVESGRVDPEDIANKFRQHCDLTRGYGMGAIRAILALRAGAAWHQVSRIVFEKGSFGNGAAMRVSPVGLFYHHDLRSLQRAAIDQANITHTHPLGQWGAVMQASSVALALLQDPKKPPKKEEILVELREILWPGPLEYQKALNEMEDIFSKGKKIETMEVVRRLGNGIEAHRSVPSASYVALTYSPDFQDAIQKAISLGGDTDTIAGMVGAIVGAQVGERGLPEEWMEQLEEGPRGFSFARELAGKLFEVWWAMPK